MRQIRNNVFETNSSSTHSIAICTEDEFNDWMDGKLYKNSTWVHKLSSHLERQKFLNIDEAMTLIKSNRHYREKDEDEKLDDYLAEFGIYSYEKWGREYEHDVNYYTTPGGENIVVECYYGTDY